MPVPMSAIFARKPRRKMMAATDPRHQNLHYLWRPLTWPTISCIWFSPERRARRKARRHIAFLVPKFWSMMTAHWARAMMSLVSGLKKSWAFMQVPHALWLSVKMTARSAGCRRGKSRHGLHVHHDEQCAPACRPARCRCCRARTQHALAYAVERKQGRAPGAGKDDNEAVAIINHPDVRRMLMSMRTMTEAARGICYENAVMADSHTQAVMRRASQIRPADPDIKSLQHRHCQ